MHQNDIIISVLTPGSPFNRKEKVWRSLETLATYTGLFAGEVLGILAGDLANQVCTKISKEPGKVLVALKSQLPEPGVEDVQIHVIAGNAQVEAAPIEDPDILGVEALQDAEG